MPYSRQLLVLFFCFAAVIARAQQMIAVPEGPAPQPGTVAGVVMDTDGAAIPGAKIAVIRNGATVDGISTVSGGDGVFSLPGVPSATAVVFNVSVNGFASWTSEPVTLAPGQYRELPEIKLAIAAINTEVTAIFPEELAKEQVKEEEKQRVLGVIPNFYVVYDHNAVPMTSALKFRLALKASTDVVTFAGVGFISGIYQAADRPDFRQGATGYGQRYGAIYADGVSDILIGGAVLPSLLHQDPRYFYQGTGTRKSRALHALSSPFICKGDNGKWQFNYSSIGGDLASGALSNLYYPESNRGANLVVNTALTAAGGRMLNALAQEFILKKLTSGNHAKE
ncbi:MAG: carboxypeptidase regulatory-like domain-containing protein [Acidobacteriaceae bacterium]|nr:carboxypeptidase regulatory-like domain-containing protein [Acidobacteriaceae bacterium]